MTSDQVIVSRAPAALSDDSFEFSFYVTSSIDNGFCDDAADSVGSRRKRESKLGDKLRTTSLYVLRQNLK